MSQPSEGKARARSEGAAAWKERIERSRQSGLGIRGFCKREGLRLSTYYRWRLQLYGRVKQKDKVRRDKPIRHAQRPFIPVQLKEGAPGGPATGNWACEVSRPGQVRLRLRERPAWGELLQLLTVMGGAR